MHGGVVWSLDEIFLVGLHGCRVIFSIHRRLRLSQQIVQRDGSRVLRDARSGCADGLRETGRRSAQKNAKRATASQPLRKHFHGFGVEL